MKLHSLIATALVVTLGSALLAQNPAENTKPATAKKAASPRLDQFGVPLPAGAIARHGAARPADVPAAGVTSVVISPDGRTAASLTRLAHVMHLWETATGKQCGEMKDNIECLSMAMTSGKSPRLIMHGGQATWSYDLASKTQELLIRGRLPAEKIALADGDRLLLRGEWDGKVRVQEVATGKVLRHFWGHPAVVMSLSASADGKVAASSAHVGVIVWDIEGGGEHPAFRGKKIPGHCVALTPDGRFLAAGSGGASSAGDGRIFAEDGHTDAIHFWDMATGRTLRSSADRNGTVSALAFAPDGRTLAVGRTDGTVRLLETATGGERRILTGQSGQITSLAWSADGRILVSASYDTTALVWDATGLSSGPPTKKLSSAELELLWSDLAGPATSRTHRAVWLLASNPAQAIPFLRERVRPTPAVDLKVIARLLSELDSMQFSVRDQASRELRKRSETAEPAMRKVLNGNPSVELRRRVEELLAALAEWSPEELRACAP